MPIFGPLSPAGEKHIDLSQADTLVVGVTMFDEEAQWQLMLKSRSAGLVPDRDLSPDEIRLVQSVGVVVSASMKYPRADRYGFPDEATRIGFLTWLRTEQRLSSCKTARFRFRSKDRGDDSPMDCLLTVMMPKSPTLQTELF